MQRYNYREAVYDDLLTYVGDELWDEEAGKPVFKDRAEFAEYLKRVAPNEEDVVNPLRVVTSDVAWKAEECLCHNFGLLAEACVAFHVVPDIANPDKCDALVRRYLIGECTEALADWLYGEAD